MKDVSLKSKDTIVGVTDDQYYSIKDEFQQIRSSLGMYISKDGTAGALHLEKEILNNALDEANNSNEFWNKRKKEITVEFYESERRFVTSDNGRGIPLDILVDAVMHKHTSTKTIGISQTRNKKQTGLNGVGLTVTAALSDYMRITSYRGLQSKTIEIIDGTLKESKIVKSKEPKFGTTVELIPSEKWLGPIDLTTDIVEDVLRNLSYIVEPDVPITFIYEKDPKAKKIKILSKTFEAQGLPSACRYLSSAMEFPPINIKCISDEFDISLAFSYDRTMDETQIASFCNYVVTSEGGCHEQAAIRAICGCLSREAKRQEPNSKFEITFDDCKKGLIIAVNLEHTKPKFEGQHKTKVSNNEVASEGSKVMSEAIFKVLNNNQGLMKKVISYLRMISKARQESSKIKGVSVKRNTTFLEDAKIAKYFTVANRNSTGYKELFLAEGDSAAGAIMNSRNPHHQAVYTVNGVTDNVHDLSLTQLLKKKMFSELIQIIGTGIGKDFDISKLRYNKIIICTDADVDGMNITSLLLCFFYIFMPELIEAGKIYKAMPPLYLMDLKSLRKFYSGREWLYSKQEYYHMLNTIIADNTEIIIDTGKTMEGTKVPKVSPMDKKAVMKWLNTNSEYRLELDNLGKKSACDTEVLEMVCFLKRVSKNESEFKRRLEKAFPEMNYDMRSCSLIGSHNGEFFSLICDSLFDKNCERFMYELNKNEFVHVWYRNKKSNNDKFKKRTIGQFFAEVNSAFNVDIDQRFKGQGEVDPELLFTTSTNPRFRKLLRIDIHDKEYTKKTFELLHGKSPKLSDARKELIANTRLSYADIDN